MGKEAKIPEFNVQGPVWGVAFTWNNSNKLIIKK